MCSEWVYCTTTPWKRSTGSSASSLGFCQIKLLDPAILALALEITLSADADESKLIAGLDHRALARALVQGLVDGLVDWMAAGQAVKQVESRGNLSPLGLVDSLEDLGLGSRAVAAESDHLA